MKQHDRMAVTAPEAWMLERLQRWCREWAFEQALLEDDGEAAVTLPGAGGLSDRPAGDAPAHASGGAETVAVSGDGAHVCVDPLVRPPEPLCPHSVALLAPLLDAPSAPPLYVMLLAPENAPGVLCIPFSRFTEPATPGELLSGLDADALRVLSLWNRRRIASASVLSGWQMAGVASSDAARILDACDWVARTGLLPPALTRSGGPPLSHPEDPRRRYLFEARRQVDRYLGRPGATAGLYALPAPDLSALPRAAEERGVYREDDPEVKP